MARAYKNIEMEQMLIALEPLLKHKGIVGYAAARNTRILQAETFEYFQMRDGLVEKYGVPELDEEGNETGRMQLRFDSPNFPKYEREVSEYALIEHEPDLFLITYEQAIGELTGEEFLACDWMFREE